jgi:hypothetical protein
MGPRNLNEKSLHRTKSKNYCRFYPLDNIPAGNNNFIILPVLKGVPFRISTSP